MKSGLTRAVVWSVPVLIVLVLISVWNPRGGYWSGVEPPKAQAEAYNTESLRRATVLNEGVYDRDKLRRLFREPQNTVSNLGYFTAGLAILFTARRRLTLSLGGACLFLSVGSGLYHASLLPEWRLLDILGVYAVLVVLVVIGFYTAWPIRTRKYEMPVAVAAWILAIAAGIHRNDVRIWNFKVLDSTTVVIAAVTIASLLALLAYRRAVNRRRYVVAVVTLAICAPLAFFGGLADRFGGVLANPDALIQGHSIWHSFGAVALVAAYEVFAAASFDRSVMDADLAVPGSYVSASLSVPPP